MPPLGPGLVLQKKHCLVLALGPIAIDSAIQERARSIPRRVVASRTYVQTKCRQWRIFSRIKNTLKINQNRIPRVIKSKLNDG
jgi:hypothetical protein